MGRMKELYQQTMEQDPLLAHFYPDVMIEERELTEIVCPNCLEDHLVQRNEVELGCETCGQEFVITGKNEISFK